MSTSLRYLLACILLLAGAVWAFESDRSLEQLAGTYAEPPSHFVRIAGSNVHLRDEGDGHPLVLLHGTGSSLHTWEAWTTRLSDSVRVIRFDLPGFGLTGPTPHQDYRIEAYVDFLTAVLDSLALDHIDLGGHSLGGQIAWAFAARYPERVGRLLLVDPAGARSRPPDALVFRVARWPLAGFVLALVDPEPFVRRSLLDAMARDDAVTDVLVSRHRDMALREGNRRAFVDRIRSGAGPDTLALGSVRVPTLLLWGERDTWTPFDDARVFLRGLPDARLISYPDVGHVPMEEIPERSALDARRFLLQSVDQ